LISGSPIPGSTTADRPRGIPRTVGRDHVDESFRLINELRASRGLPPIAEDLLTPDPYVSVDARLTKALMFGTERRLDLFLEAYNLTNHTNFQPFTINGNIIAGDFLFRNSARDPSQIEWGVRYAF
jgi:hypothetical protein